MNSAKLQDTRLIYINLLHFYTLIIKYQKKIKEIIPSNIPLKKNETPRNKLIQGDERPVHWKL